MGRRVWLENAIADDYLPAIAQLEDSPHSHQQATQLAQKIRDHWSQQGLTELSQQQSLMDRTRRAIKDCFGEHHFSLDYIKFSTDEYIELNNAKQGRVAERNENVQFLDNPDAIVNGAIALLDSPQWAEMAAGLSVVTGRRSSEILSTAQFAPSSQWSVTFTGALKRRGESQILSFEIPTLASASAVIQALNQVRQQLPDAVHLSAEAVNRQYGSAVIRACDRHFEGLVPTRTGQDNLYTHLFRSVYATIATFWYCPPNVNEVEFKAAIQGHYAIIDEPNQERRRSLTASRHYSDYEIGDRFIAQYGGQRKGVKLGLEGVRMIESFRGSIGDESVASEPTRDRSSLTSLRIWQSDKPLLQAIFTRLGLEGVGTQAERLGHFLRWAKQTLDGTDSTPNPPSETITSLSAQETVESSDTKVATLDKTLQSLGPNEVIQSQPTSETTKPSTLQSESPFTTELEDSASETLTSSGLEAKLDRLVDVMAQFLEFQMQTSQGQTSRTRTSTTAEARSTSVRVKTNEAEASTPRAPRNSPVAEAAINGAIEAIMAHNNATELHDLKWAITINAVKELVAAVTKSQRLVQKILTERSSEIENHHTQHHLEPHHNHRHKRKRQIQNAIALTAINTLD